jgi:transposase
MRPCFRPQERTRLIARANALARQGQTAGAITAAEEAIAIEREVYGDSHSNVPESLQFLARQKNSLLFLDLLYKLVTKTYRGASRIHLILDNYGIHDSQQVQLALKSAAASRIRLHFLPPYCPDHNRIERT